LLPTSLRFSRFECKYLLAAPLRRAVEAALRPFLVPDPHAVSRGATDYRVRSLYFDDPAWSAFHAKMDGLPTRSKFRLRTYARSADDAAPWFLECKGRHEGRVWKHRTPFRAGAGPAASGDGLVAAVLRDAVPAPTRDAFEVAVLRRRIAPVVLVDYRREAWHCPLAPDFRVTIDDALAAVATDCMFPDHLPLRSLLAGEAVLEVKFRAGVPPWFVRIVREFGLQHRSLSKVCTAILALGLARES
jgi:hypothetical protein